MEQLKSAINWFEIPATDFNRAVRFYSEIYDFEMPTRDMGHFAIIDDTEGNRVHLHSMN